ncbi:MAG TPA: hypothetical protein VK961_17255 [Chthoniobacter sp.]|nr:hypothetical protein [Chthoniobacter sp.]
MRQSRTLLALLIVTLVALLAGPLVFFSHGSAGVLFLLLAFLAGACLFSCAPLFVNRR